MLLLGLKIKVKTSKSVCGMNSKAIFFCCFMQCFWQQCHSVLCGCQWKPLGMLFGSKYPHLFSGWQRTQDLVWGQAALPLCRGEPGDPNHCLRELKALPCRELLHPLFPVGDRWGISGTWKHSYFSAHLAVSSFVCSTFFLSLFQCGDLPLSFALSLVSETWWGRDQKNQQYDDTVELPKLLEPSLLLLPPHFPDCTAQKTVQKVWGPMLWFKSRKGKRNKNI